ncbi:MAG: Gfo/Idh/MocA family protein [Intestinibacillus sp.]
MSKIKWGIIGPGWVGNRFAEGLSYTEEGEVYAVSDIIKERADAFAAKHGCTKSYGSNEELLADPDVDIIYVAILNPSHRDVVCQVLDAGKPCVCEKPFALNAKQARQMVDKAREKNVFLMEAMWSRFSPIAAVVREWLDKKAIGEVKMAMLDQGFMLNEGMDYNKPSRQFDRQLGGGAMMDVGCYAVNYASMIFGWEPEEIKATASIGPTGVDEQSTIVMRYKNGAQAVVMDSLVHETPQILFISGTGGHIQVRMAFMDCEDAVLTVEHKLEPGFPAKIEKVHIPMDGRGYRYEAEEAMRCLKAGKKESDILPLDETIGVMKIMDEARRQWGLTYPGE